MGGGGGWLISGDGGDGGVTLKDELEATIK